MRVSCCPENRELYNNDPLTASLNWWCNRVMETGSSNTPRLGRARLCAMLFVEKTFKIDVSKVKLSEHEALLVVFTFKELYAVRVLGLKGERFPLYMNIV